MVLFFVAFFLSPAFLSRAICLCFATFYTHFMIYTLYKFIYVCKAVAPNSKMYLGSTDFVIHQTPTMILNELNCYKIVSHFEGFFCVCM